MDPQARHQARQIGLTRGLHRSVTPFRSFAMKKATQSHGSTTSFARRHRRRVTMTNRLNALGGASTAKILSALREFKDFRPRQLSYAVFAANKLGVPVTTKLKELT